MSVPNCPVHGTPMRAGNHGGFFCPQKIGAGPKDYCVQKVAGAPQPAYVPPQQAPPQGYAVPPASSPRPASSQDGKYHLAAAALTAASWTWGQVDPTMHNEVLVAAKRFYAEMKAMAES